MKNRVPLEDFLVNGGDQTWVFITTGVFFVIIAIIAVIKYRRKK